MNKKWKKEISISKHLKDKDRVNLSLLRNKEKNYQIKEYSLNVVDVFYDFKFFSRAHKIRW